MRMYVIAPDYKAFRAWCWERSIPEQSAVYVSRAELLRGVSLRTGQIAFVPGWGNRKDALELDAQVERITGTSMVVAQ